jgi:hypothetical protein
MLKTRPPIATLIGARTTFAVTTMLRIAATQVSLTAKTMLIAATHGNTDIGDGDTTRGSVNAEKNNYMKGLSLHSDQRRHFSWAQSA